MQEHKTIIKNFYNNHRRMPSYSEMMKLFNFKSKNAVYRLAAKMVAAGFVAKDSLGRLIPSGSFDEMPLAGLVKAGLPSSVDELQDSINIESYIGGKTGETYMLEVDGNSMIDAHITDGDMVIVEKTNHAKDGDIVIANIDGEFTMKYLRIAQGKTWLEPANKDFKPMYPKENLNVIARVKGVIRKY